MKIPDLILTADWHLRDTQPVCRTDDFWDAQWRKVQFVRKLQKKYKCPVFHAGDLFDHWKPSPFLLSETIKQLPKNFHTVYGNHDLPQHSIKLRHLSGINVLERAKVLTTFPFGHLNDVPKQSDFIEYAGKRVYVWHKFIYDGTAPFPGAKGHVRSAVRKYPFYDLIVTGDNHQSFARKHKNTLLVNCGSLTRQSASQIDFEPCVWLWYANTNKVRKIPLPYEQNVVTREHIEKTEQRDERINAFISRLVNEEQMVLSFEKNVERFLAQNKVRRDVKEVINNVLY